MSQSSTRVASVVTGLTQNDFTITEDKKQQRIFSFEAPQTHLIRAKTSDENPDGIPFAEVDLNSNASPSYSSRECLEPRERVFPGKTGLTADEFGFICFVGKFKRMHNGQPGTVMMRKGYGVIKSKP